VTARLPAKSLRDAAPVGFHDTHRLWKMGKILHARAIPSETARSANKPYDPSQSFKKTGFWSVLGASSRAPTRYFITVRTEMRPRGCQVRDMRLLRTCKELNSVQCTYVERTTAEQLPYIPARLEQDQDGTSSVLILLASCQHTCMTYTIAVCTVKNS